MDASTVIAICGVAIAVVSLGLSAYVAWATRNHNRLSVRPLLGLTATFPVGATAGLRLTNSGLGPARIISSKLTSDGKEFGEFNKAHVDDFRRSLGRYFKIQRFFPTSHNWHHLEPNRKAVKTVNMHKNVHIPFISRMPAVEYSFICSPRTADGVEVPRLDLEVVINRRRVRVLGV